MSRRGAALDPRLLRHAQATRGFVLASAGLGSLQAALIVAQAWLLALLVSEVFIHGRTPSSLRTPFAALLAVVLARAVLAWLAELVSVRASARAKSQLRLALLDAGGELAARGDPRAHSAGLAVLASRGLDALDDYFSQYLPQLLLAAIVPLAVLVAVCTQDWISAAIIAVTLPLIPLFMALVGAVTGERTAARLVALERLAGHFLDVVAGLPTLKIFGRGRVQPERIAATTESYRRSTLATLRVTFSSSLILELLATLSVAMVAVAIGLRLIGGDMTFQAGLFALVLAPEAYLPLRRLGASYHASADGVAAAERAFAVIDAAGEHRDGALAAPDPSLCVLELDGVGFTYPDREQPALRDASLVLRPGEVLGLTGPSGCGKSTALAVILGLVEPDRGSARIGEIEIGALDPESWRRQLAWLPQRPHLFRAPLRENVALGNPAAGDAQLERALAAVGMLDVVRELPAGWDTMLGEDGQGLSSGQRRRLALARTLLRDAPLVLLDEPTAGLDSATEQLVVASLAQALRGRSAVIVAHRPALLELCDSVLALAPAHEATLAGQR